MKKLLALALTLVMTLGLVSPALAAEDGYTDPYEEYAQAHPEELANLDVDALLAGWGYHDMTAGEAFMEDYANYNNTLEEAVKDHYLQMRLMAREDAENAPLYQEEYPEAWADFNADAYFQEEYGEHWDKAEYMAWYCLRSEEEFVDDMFTDYIEYGDYDDDWDDEDPWDEPDGAPTLTLYVNGVASDAVITAENGVSYADADALRDLLGDAAVAADAEGNIAIRAAAEAAGWDIQWYDGGWRGNDQEIQLWDKAKYEGELAEEFGPMNGFFAKAMDQSMDLLFSQTPISGHETVDIALTRFSTLDENKEYTLKLGVDYVVQKGVMDITLTFDVSQLLQFVDPRDLAGWAKEGGFTVSQLTALLKAGTAELILDYNENTMAYNVPLLALFDEDEAGWQTVYSGTSLVLPDLGELKDFSFVSSLYATMTTTAGYMGAEYAAQNYETTMAALKLFCGKDRFSTKNGKTTYSMTTQDMNRAAGELIAQAAGLEEAPQVSLFKHCELTYTLDEGGNMDMELHFRPDVEGIRNAVAAQYGGDDTYYGMATLLGWYLPALDMDVTANGRGNQSRYVSGMNVHWNNVGTMELRCAATSGTALTGPRQIGDV